MRSRVVLSGLAVLAVLGSAAPPATAAPATRALYTLHDPRLREVSGIGVGIVSPGVDYVENDSGDSARFFALDGTSGDVLGEFHVPGATNVDWEDLAVAPDAQGVPSVWLADIGDNDSKRSSVAIYRVDEPRVQPGHPVGVRTTAAPQTWRLAYPDGPHNAESLAITPQGVAYVITKDTDGVDGVYRVPDAPAPGGGVATMTRVGTIAIPSGLPVAPALLVTGADISRDGRWLVVRTYLAAYLWSLDGGSDPVGAAVSTAPAVVPLPVQPLGEAVAFAGSDDELIVASEQVNSTVYAVYLPAPASPSAPPPPIATSAAAAPASHQHAVLPWVVLGAVAVAAVAVGLVVRQGGPARRERR